MSKNAEPMVKLPVRIDDLIKALVKAADTHRETFAALEDHAQKYPKMPSGALFVTVELDDTRQAWKAEKDNLEGLYKAALREFQTAAFRLAAAYSLLDIPF